MTHEEFKEVIIALYAAFPGINKWVRENSPDQAATHGSWFRTLQPFTKAECLAIVQSWERGDRNPPSYVDMAHMALTIRACVLFDRNKLASSQTQQEEQRRYTKGREGKDSLFPLGKLYGAFLAKLDGGRNVEQAQSEIMAEIDKIPVREDFRRTHKCFACCDDGIREVHHPDDIRAIKDGKLQRGDVIHKCTVACHTCEKGTAMASATGWKRGAMPKFDAGYYCLVESDPFEFAAKPLAEAWVP